MDYFNAITETIKLVGFIFTVVAVILNNWNLKLWVEIKKDKDTGEYNSAFTVLGPVDSKKSKRYFAWSNICFFVGVILYVFISIMQIIKMCVCQ